MQPNSFQGFLAQSAIFNAGNFLQFETRYYLNGDDLPDYMAISLVPGALESDKVWMVYKFTYSGTTIETRTRQQLPDDGVGFLYAAADRATLFS